MANDYGMRSLSPLSPRLCHRIRQDCVSCSSGEYCETTGLLAPTGPCSSGYYCKRGAQGAAPTGGTYDVGSLEYGGDICPVGTYCPNGTDTPLACKAGSYNDLRGQEECFACPGGYFCQANSTEYEGSSCPTGYVKLSTKMMETNGGRGFDARSCRCRFNTSSKYVFELRYIQ